MIGQFVRTTTAAWPGRDCCFIGFMGTDVRCPYLPPDYWEEGGDEVPAEEILSYVRERGSTLDGIVLGGGEPLRDKNLYPLLKELRKRKRPIMLETQGMRPDALDDLAGAMMFDRVRLYVPACPGSPGLERATGGTCDPDLLRRSMDIVNRLDVPHEFVTYAVPGIVDAKEAEEIARSAEGKTEVVLAQFVPEKASDPGYRKKRPYSRSEASALSAAAKRYSRKVSIRGF